MIRRLFVRRVSSCCTVGCAAVAAAVASEATVVPTDADALNEFAVHYNTYAANLKRGVVDVKGWRRVERAWSKLR